MHPTTDKGDIGVAVVAADLIKKGLNVLQPLSSSLPYDLVIHVPAKDKFFKVQVKYRDPKNDCIMFQMTRASIGGGRVMKRRILPHEVDIYAVYCPSTDTCYYLEAKGLTGLTDVRLRLAHPKNNQKSNIRLADDYLTLDFLK